MKRTCLFVIAAAMSGAALVAQSVPEINFDAVADIISLRCGDKFARPCLRLCEDGSRCGDAW